MSPEVESSHGLYVIHSCIMSRQSSHHEYNYAVLVNSIRSPFNYAVVQFLAKFYWGMWVDGGPFQLDDIPWIEGMEVDSEVLSESLSSAAGGVLIVGLYKLLRHCFHLCQGENVFSRWVFHTGGEGRLFQTLPLEWGTLPGNAQWHLHHSG